MSDTDKQTDQPKDPRGGYHTGPFPEQEQKQPGLTAPMDPKPDHGELSYEGNGKLEGKAALITGGDSGIGKAAAIAFAREGADVAISYLPEEEDDAQDTADWIRKAGRAPCCSPATAARRTSAPDRGGRRWQEFGRLDVLVLNAAYQKNRESFETLPTEEFDRVFRTNLYSLLWTARAAVPHLKAGASIITTASIQAFNPSPGLIDYAMTKAAQVAFTKALAQELGPKGIRVNAVAPGPIWTPADPGHRMARQAPVIRPGHAPCSGQGNRPSSPRPMCCWHRKMARTSPERSFRSPGARGSKQERTA